MSSAHNPAENASIHAPPPQTEHDVRADELGDGDDGSSEVSDGGNLRVRTFHSPIHRDASHNGWNFQSDLEDVLEGDFDFRGKFALSETFKSTPLPSLHIDGIGTISFPLTEQDAKLIENVATQAPFGKGTETVVDTTIRDTFEINPDKFSLRNPSWTEFFQTVVIKKVAAGLGLPPNLPPPRADLYKLLLYKTGSQ